MQSMFVHEFNLQFIAMTFLCIGMMAAALAIDGPRVEKNGRVVVIDDFESGLNAWQGTGIEIGEGPVKGSKALLWRVADVDATLTYRFADKIPDLGKYTRIAMDIRGWNADGLQGPGVATYTYLILGGLPWQLTNMPPWWTMWDRRPVFGDTWRSLSFSTRYPEWYNFGMQTDNTKPTLMLGSTALFSRSGTVMIDNIRLIADPVEVLGKEEGGVWGEGRWLDNGNYRYEYSIRLHNLTNDPQTVRATAARSLSKFRGGLLIPTVKLEPGKDGVITAFVEVPKSVLTKISDLYHEEYLVTVAADGAPGTEQLVPLLASKPFPALKRPFILHPQAWWTAERERFFKLDANTRDAALAAANKLLLQTKPFPVQPTLSTKKKINSGAEVVLTDWSPEDQKTFTENFAAIRTLGEAYQRTRDERYVQKAGAMMVEFAGKYAQYPWHGNYEVSDQGMSRIAMNNLHEGYWITDLMGSYDLILDSPSLTATDREKIADQFVKVAGRHETPICSSFSNQTSNRFTAAAMCGFILNDANLVQYAVYGHHGLAKSAEVSISPDGFLSEIPINYHWANLREMLRLPLVCRHAGLKLSVGFDRVRKACDTPYLRAMPNQSAPPFGSCGYGTGIAGFNLGDYPAVYEMFGDPVYRQLSDRAQAQKVIDGLPSLVFDEGGIIVLREPGKTGADRQYLAILSTNTRRAADQTLHFVYYADGLLLCPSPGTMYNAHGDAAWNSPWNNTILVDGKGQRSCLGKVLAHDFSGEAQMALIDAGPVYDGVTLQRAVALSNGMLFIIDRAASADEHTYERVQMVGQEIARPPAEKTDLERSEGANIRLQGTRLDGDWSMQWKSANGPSLELKMAGAPGSEVFWGYNQVNGYKPAMCAPTVLVRRKCRETVFLTVMEPFKDHPSQLQAVRRIPVLVNGKEAADAQATALEAVTANGRIVFVVNYDGKPKTCLGKTITAPLTIF